MNLKNKKVLITGATGFVGTSLVRRFLTEGSRVAVSVRRESDRWRIKDVLKDVSIHTVDLTQASLVRKAVARIRPEIIIHTAVYGGYVYQQDIKKIFDVNMMGTVYLLNACKERGFSFFLNTGSSSEYGLKNHPIKECEAPEPVTGYGVSKAASTLYCQSVARKDRLPIATLRLFSPYGYFEDPSRLVPDAVVSCLRKKTVKLSSPHNVRDFIFIEDVVDAYVKAIEKNNIISGEVLNIGSGRQHSVGEIVKNIVDLTGAEVKLEWNKIHNPRLEPLRWQADISKAKRLLGWAPRHNLRQGLEKTIRWFAKNMDLY